MDNVPENVFLIFFVIPVLVLFVAMWIVEAIALSRLTEKQLGQKDILSYIPILSYVPLVKLSNIKATEATQFSYVAVIICVILIYLVSPLKAVGIYKIMVARVENKTTALLVAILSAFFPIIGSFGILSVSNKSVNPNVDQSSAFDLLVLN